MRAVGAQKRDRKQRQRTNGDAQHEGVNEIGRKNARHKNNQLSSAASPNTINVRGIDVNFPFKPYDVQVNYMNTVMDALLRSENGILESPTGTGKTLCLLCTALGWQREQFRLLRTAHSDFMNADQSSKMSHETSATNMQEPELVVPARFPTIIYASRTHSQLSQVIRELRNTQYRPRHAVLGSREQFCVNPKVKSPNSTSYEVNHDCSKLCKERKCNYRNNLEGFTVPQSCKESYGCTAETHLQPVMDMEELVTMGKKSKVCPFYYTRGLVDKAELILVPYNYLFDKDARATTLAEIPWDNAVVIFDEAHNLEAFASDSASFEFSSTDIAGCVSEVQKGINYVQAMPAIAISLKLENLIKLKALFLQLEDFILNLGQQSAYSGEYMIEIFRQGASITYANHEIFVEEVKKVIELVMDARSSSSAAHRGSPRLEHFSQCVKRVFGNTLESRCLAKAAFYRVYVSPKIPAISSTVSFKQSHLSKSSGTSINGGRTVSYWCFAPSLAMEELSSLNVRSILVTSGTLSPLPSYSMELGLRFPHTLENPHIVKDDQIHVRIFASGPTGKLLSSAFGRRQDVEYYQELGSTILELAKVTPDGMLIFFPSYSVMETCIERWGGPNRKKSQETQNSFFAARRKQAAMFNRYSFPHVPSFFSSLDGNVRTIWQQLVATKSIVLEPKTSAELSQAIAEFEKFLASENSAGCILMGVCRGKISEGIDFANEQSRAVVVTGLPFPPAMDPKVKMKREFLDKIKATTNESTRYDSGFNASEAATKAQNMLSGNEWYTQQAHRAVNQAIGRVIRNQSDYGAVLLLDSRFGQPSNQAGLSKWIRPHIQADEGFSTGIKCLNEFFQTAEASAPTRSLPTVVLDGSEMETTDDKPTQLVIVKCSNTAQVSSIDSEKSAYVPDNAVVARVNISEYNASSIVAQNTTKEGVSKKRVRWGNDAVFHLNPVPQKRPKLVPASKELAVKFMEKAKIALSPSELSNIRKAIVAMKRFGEKKEQEKYLQSASEIVRIVLHSENFELANNIDEKSMLFLFFALLPPKYRKTIELNAFGALFSCSSFGHLYDNGCLAPELVISLKYQVSLLLHTLWCRDSNTRVKKELFYKEIQEICLTHEMSGTGQYDTMIQCLCELLPSDFELWARTMSNEIAASRNVEIMRLTDKSRTGADALGFARFQTVKTRTSNEDENGPKRQVTHKSVKPDLGLILPELNLESCQAPAIKSDIPMERVINRVSMSPAARTDVTLMNSHVVVAKPSYSSLLQTMELETYLMKKATDVATHFPSGEPVDVECPVCNHKIIEPCVAQCGHMACFPCWSNWLKISNTCITCRSRVTHESLSQVVYEGNKTSHPLDAHNREALTQPGDERSDSDELEILT